MKAQQSLYVGFFFLQLLTGLCMSSSQARFLSDYTPSNFSISKVNLSFDLDDKATRVQSELHISRVGNHNAPLELVGEQLVLEDVRVNQRLLKPSDYQLTDSNLTIAIEENEFIVNITTVINPEENTSLEGLFKSGGAFCTQCEAEGFRRITYYLDRPDVMATFTTKVIADKNLYPQLLSNGNQIDKGDIGETKHFVTWFDPFPKPSYLFALVAGDFDLLSSSYTTSENKEVALEIFVDKGNLSKAQHAMTSLKKSMAWDEEVFGLSYDLDIYMIVAVDFFNMGAMENKGLNVFNSKFVLADKASATDTDYFNIEAVIAHEYFHNWTGNRVTCRDWFQLSLKEGLTVFRDQQFSADMHSSAVTRIQNVRVLRSMQFAEDAGPMSHPIRPEKVLEMNNFYTLTVYEKGSEVIRMLYTLLGKDNFRAGMDLYFKRFDGMAVTCDDFINAMSEASDIDLTQFKHWYSQSGTPVITVNEIFDEANGEYQLSLKQDLPSANNKEKVNLHLPIKIELIDLNSATQKNANHLLELTDKQQAWTFTGFKEKPVLAMLADFSAPVKLEFSQSDAELMQIIANGQNSFCRWDAGQKLLMNYLHKLTQDPLFELPQELLTCFNAVLSAKDDEAFIAEQLQLPSFGEAADLIPKVDPIALAKAHNALTSFLAVGLENSLIKTFERCQKLLINAATSTSQEQEKESVEGLRALKNTCLMYLTSIEGHHLLAESQYKLSDNMTDTLAALSCSVKHNLPALSEQSNDFENTWSETTLVMDKWFTLWANCSSDDIFEKLDSLLAHPLFSLNNPNRARSLIGAFSMQNPLHFHNAQGLGYQFLADQIIQLNEINPQVAARLISPLIQFNSFNDHHATLMKEQLERIKKLPKLSKDLKEKIDAAIG
ncbi:MAG: aminopeptidase N [Colwellia sp.]